MSRILISYWRLCKVFLATNVTCMTTMITAATKAIALDKARTVQVKVSFLSQRVLWISFYIVYWFFTLAHCLNKLLFLQ